MQNIITRLQQLVSEVPESFRQFSPETLSVRPAPGKWSKREILGHLCDSALHNWQRFTAAQRQTEPLHIVSYPQDDLVRLNGYQDQPIGQITMLWASLNTQIVTVLKAIPMEKHSQPVILPDGKEVTLQLLAEEYLAHLEHHLEQIFPKKITPPSLPGPWQITVDEALTALANHPEGKPFVTLLEHGRMSVELYQPVKMDLQTPHNQDEIYVVISGNGWFFNQGVRRVFRPGDVLFVPAGIEHRFEDFSEDFKTCLIFY